MPRTTISQPYCCLLQPYTYSRDCLEQGPQRLELAPMTLSRGRIWGEGSPSLPQEGGPSLGVPLQGLNTLEQES